MTADSNVSNIWWKSFLSFYWLKKYKTLIIVLFISSIIFVGLGNSSLLDYDEGIYAQVAREVLQTNDWLTLSFGREPWFEKPPLHIWITAFLFKLFSVNEFWARAASAFSGILVTVLTYILGSHIFGRRVGFLSIVPLLSGYEFLRQARNGTTDILLTLFIIMTLIAYIKHPQNGRFYWYFVWVSFALGFMVKFWAALIVILAIGINIILERKLKETIGSKHFWLAILVALAIILPWHIIMYDMHGKAFIDRYILYDLLARSVGSLEGNDGTTRYYFDRILYDYSPWFLFLPIALANEAKRILVARDRSSVLLIFVGCIFGIYSLIVNTKIFHYLTPIYPILALFIANAILQAYENNKSTAYGGLIVAGFLSLIVPSRKVVVLFLILITVMLVLLFILRRVSFHRRLVSRTPVLKSAPREIDGAANHFLHWLSFIADRKNFAKLTMLIILFFFTLVGILRSRSLYKVVDSPVEQIARVAGMSNIVRDETVVALALPPDYQYAIVGPTAMFYSYRPIIVAWSEDQLSQFTSDGPREIIMAEIFIESLNNEYEFTILAESPPFIYGIIQQREGSDSSQGDIFSYSFDTETLQSEYEKVFSVQRAFDLEMASIWRRK